MQQKKAPDSIEARRIKADLRMMSTYVLKHKTVALFLTLSICVATIAPYFMDIQYLPDITFQYAAFSVIWLPMLMLIFLFSITMLQLPALTLAVVGSVSAKMRTLYVDLRVHSKPDIVFVRRLFLLSLPMAITPMSSVTALHGLYSPQIHGIIGHVAVPLVGLLFLLHWNIGTLASRIIFVFYYSLTSLMLSITILFSYTIASDKSQDSYLFHISVLFILSLLFPVSSAFALAIFRKIHRNRSSICRLCTVSFLNGCVLFLLIAFVSNSPAYLPGRVIRTLKIGNIDGISITVSKKTREQLELYSDRFHKEDINGNTLHNLRLDWRGKDTLRFSYTHPITDKVFRFTVATPDFVPDFSSARIKKAGPLSKSLEARTEDETQCNP